MNCNNCNRLLIAREAKIVDTYDSAAELELPCECGAVYIHRVEHDEWIRKEIGAIVSQREFVNTPKGIFRWITADFYGFYGTGREAKEFIYRLPLNDPRPMGMEMTGMTHLGEWISQFPFNQWVELTSPNSDHE